MQHTGNLESTNMSSFFFLSKNLANLVCKRTWKSLQVVVGHKMKKPTQCRNGVLSQSGMTAERMRNLKGCCVYAISRLILCLFVCLFVFSFILDIYPQSHPRSTTCTHYPRPMTSKYTLASVAISCCLRTNKYVAKRWKK